MIKVPDSKLMVLSSLKEYFQDISVINVWEQLKGNSQDYFALTVFKCQKWTECNIECFWIIWCWDIAAAESTPVWVQRRFWSSSPLGEAVYRCKGPTPQKLLIHLQTKIISQKRTHYAEYSTDGLCQSWVISPTKFCMNKVYEMILGQIAKDIYSM